MGSRDTTGAVEQKLSGIGEVPDADTTINQSNGLPQVSDGASQKHDARAMVSCGGEK